MTSKPASTNAQDSAIGDSGCEVPGPDPAGYTCETTAFDFEDISTSGTPIFLGDEELSASIPMGFTFPFYGQNLSEIRIGSNGYLTANDFFHFLCCIDGQDHPDSSHPNNLIAGYWEDLDPGAGGTIHYETVGEAPNRTFIVQFTAVQHFPVGFPVTFQFQLMENGTVEVHYAVATSDGDFHSAGIESPSGFFGLRYKIGSFHEAASAVRYNSSTPLTVPQPDLTVTDLNLTPEAPTTFAALSVTATVENQGEDLVHETVTRVQIDAPEGPVVNLSTPHLLPGESANVTAEFEPLGAADHNVTATADASDDVAESSETNNTQLEAFTVSPPPDLQSLPFDDDVEEGPGDWTSSGLWHITTDRANSPTHAWYYGQENGPGLEDNDYDTGSDNRGELISPALNLTGVDEAQLSFWTFWEGEGCQWEHPIVQVQPEGGTFETVWEDCRPEGDGDVSVDLSAYAGQIVRLRFLWDTLDGINNDFEGWYVDDINVSVPPPPQPGVVANGGFETGTLSNWSVVNQGSGDWFAYSGTTSPASGHEIAAPPEGEFAATTDQNGPGSHMMTQDIVPTTNDSTLSFVLYYENRNDEFHTPNTLSHEEEPNQQYRVDLIDPNASIDSVAPEDVVENLFITEEGDPLSLEPTLMSFNLSEYVGQELRLRFAEVDNQFFFQASVDRVRLSSENAVDEPSSTAPDLLVEDILLEPEEPTEGDGVEFTALVHNQGNATAGPTDTYFQIDAPDGPDITIDTPSIAPNETVNVTTPPSPGLSAGNHTITAVADFSAEEEELNETNNERVEEFVVAGPPLPDTVCDLPCSEDFDDGAADGFALSGLWHVSDACDVPPSPPNYLAYNQDQTCTYDTGGSNSGAAIVAVDLSNTSAPVLTFNHRHETEAEAPFDQMRLEVSTDNGTSWTTLADYTGQQPIGWTSVTVDLSDHVSEQTLLRWNFDTVDEIFNDFEGWFIDNVLVAEDDSDPAVDSLEVHKRQLRTNFTDPVVNPVGSIDLQIGLANTQPEAMLADGTVSAFACPQEGDFASPPSLQGCEFIGEEPFQLAENGQRTVEMTWDHQGSVGDFEVCAIVDYPLPQDTGNDEACTETFVVVGGTGLGGVRVLP